MRWLSRVVSVVVIVVGLTAAFLLLRSKMPATHVGQHFQAYARFRDGSRLALGSPVMIAGVRIGEISRLTIEGTFARVDLSLRDDSQIPIDSWITKKAESAFGDSYLEIIPTGGSEPGAAPVIMLKSGEQITHVIEGGSTDTTLRTIARTMPKIDNGLEAVHDFAMDGRKFTSGKLVDALTGADRWLAEGHIEKPLDAADKAMERFETGTTNAADAIHGANVNGRIRDFNGSVTNARKQMADLKQGLKDGLKGARDGVDRVDPTIDQMRDVVSAIDEARGSDAKARFGRAINDHELGDTLDDVTGDVKDASGGLDPFRSWVGFRAEFDIFARLPRFYVSAELRSRNDTFFLVEASKSPEGALPHDQLDEVVNAPQYNRYQEIDEGPKFTLQFGKRFGMLQLRGGLKDSTFGIGSDLLLGTRLKLTADVFGGFQRVPRVKLYAAVQVFRSIYITGGVDDLLTSPGYLPIETGNSDVPHYFDKVHYGRDYFVGATLQFSDADLAMLVRVYGAMIAGLVLL